MTPVPRANDAFHDWEEYVSNSEEMWVQRCRKCGAEIRHSMRENHPSLIVIGPCVRSK